MNLTTQEIEQVAFRLAREKLAFKEPIPNFGTRFPNILESCLIVPFQQFDNKHLYHGLAGKGAILLYLMIKNHPFQNGNKRVAMTTLMYWLHKNKKWLKVDQKKLYNFTVWVAESQPEFKEEVVKSIEKFIKTYLVSL